MAHNKCKRYKMLKV